MVRGLRSHGWSNVLTCSKKYTLNHNFHSMGMSCRSDAGESSRVVLARMVDTQTVLEGRIAIGICGPAFRVFPDTVLPT